MSSYLSAIASGATRKISELAEYTSNRYFPSADKVAAFFQAYQEGKFAVVKNMVDSGMDPNILNEDGNGLVHLLAGRLEMERVRPDGSRAPFGRTEAQVTDFLKSIGVNFHARNGEGLTARDIIAFDETKPGLLAEIDRSSST